MLGSSLYQLGIVEDYVSEVTFSDAIRAQRQKGTPLKEEHVWKILSSLAETLAHTQEKQCTDFSLLPDSIYVTEQGELKVSLKPASREKLHYGRDDINYLPPQLVAVLDYKSDFVREKMKETVWTIGKCLLEMIYSKSSFDLNREKDDAKLDLILGEELADSYS